MFITAARPSFKESAALALAAAQNYEWMTLDWLKCNRRFLRHQVNAWKALLLVECQKNVSGVPSRGLSQFGSATELEFPPEVRG